METRTVAVRINALDTAHGYQDILAVAEAAGSRIDSIVVPKVDRPGDIHFVSRLLDGIEMNRGIQQPIGIEASIESAEGLENVSATARASKRIKTLVFGKIRLMTQVPLSNRGRGVAGRLQHLRDGYFLAIEVL